jgi:hypothetical protein
MENSPTGLPPPAHSDLPPRGTDFAAIGQARLDTLGDLVAEHRHTAVLTQLIIGGPDARAAVGLGLAQ